MVKKFKSASSAKEPLVFKNPTPRQRIQAISEGFVTSPQQLLNRLILLRRTLEANTHESLNFEQPAASPNGVFQPICIWTPLADFSYSTFASRASETYEAWYIAKDLNKEIAAFNGETLRPLVQLFEKIRPPIAKADSPVFADFYHWFCEFRNSVHQLQSRYQFNEKQLEKLQAEQVFAVPEYVKPKLPALPFGLQHCDIPQTLKRNGWDDPVFVKNDDYWKLMEELMKASPNAIPESKLKHLFVNRNDRENAPKQLRFIISSLGLTVKDWTLTELDT